MAKSSIHSVSSRFVRHPALGLALGLPLGDLARAGAASGVMMLPIPRSGTLRAVHGQDAARGTLRVAGALGREGRWLDALDEAFARA